MSEEEIQESGKSEEKLHSPPDSSRHSSHRMKAREIEEGEGAVLTLLRHFGRGNQGLG